MIKKENVTGEGVTEKRQQCVTYYMNGPLCDLDSSKVAFISLKHALRYAWTFTSFWPKNIIKFFFAQINFIVRIVLVLIIVSDVFHLQKKTCIKWLILTKTRIIYQSVSTAQKTILSSKIIPLLNRFVRYFVSLFHFEYNLTNHSHSVLLYLLKMTKNNDRH